MNLRRVGLTGCSIFGLIALGLVLLGQWTRAAAFEGTLYIIFWQNVVVALLLFMVTFEVIRDALASGPSYRGRLLVYTAIIVGVLIVPVVVLASWTPTFLVYLIAIECYLVAAAGIILTHPKSKTGLYYLFGSIVAVCVVVQYSAQVRLLKQFDWDSASPKKILTVLVGTSLDAADTIRSSVRIAFDKPESLSSPKIKEVRLRIEPGSIEAMAKNLPTSAKSKYYNGQLLYPDGSWKKIKYRMRGRSVWHWMPEKPSLRVRLRKENPLSLQRHINFVNPEDRAMVSNMLGDEIARNMGVLTHINEFVRLYINDKFFGIYHQTTREDEEMLRLNRRVPGPLIVGDFLTLPWRAIDFEYAEQTAILDKVNPLEQMVSALNATVSVERYEKLWKAVSFEKLARWDAALKIVGGIHTDDSHNHAYYFDPRLGKLEPILTDVNGHGLLTHPRWLDRHLQPYEGNVEIPLNERLQPLLDAALRDPRFMHRRNKLVYEALKGAGSEQLQNRILDQYYTKIDQDVLADRHKAALEGTGIGVARQPFSNAQYLESKESLRRWIRGRNSFLRDQLEDVAVSLSMASTGTGGSFVKISVSGNSAADLIPPKSIVNLSVDRFRTGRFKPVKPQLMTLYPGLTKDVEFQYSYIGSGQDRYYLRPGIQSYMFRIDDLAPAQLEPLLRSAFRSSLSGKSVAVETEIVAYIDPDTVSYNENTVHPWDFPEVKTKDISFGPGTHIVQTDIVVEPTQRLLVSAGAKLKLGPGVSIVSRGQAHFAGTQEKPISISRSESNSAWGGLLILGDASAGSKISYTNISGGSRAIHANVISSGMVSIYDSKNTEVLDSTFSKNILSDDTLHVVYGNVRLLRNRFEDCFGDCIDFDYTDGDIKDLLIKRAGNDGIDFMSSEAKLTDIRIEIAGDKGLSVGELSKVLGANIDISHTVTAIAAKDKSQLKLSGGALRNSEIGIDIFKKNWRYGGPGTVSIFATEFVGNQVDARHEAGGTLTVDKRSNPKTFAGDGEVVFRK